MKNNEGFSLVELVVVIAIMAILGSGVVITFYSSSSYRARQAARQIDSVLTETRVQALSKESAWMEIDRDSDGTYVLKTSYDGETKLKGKFTISYELYGASGETEITGNVPGSTALALSYSRTTGGFLKTLDESYEEGTDYCSKILITYGTKTYEISLSKNTGKHSLID